VAAHLGFDLFPEQIERGVKRSARKPTCCRPSPFQQAGWNVAVL